MIEKKPLKWERKCRNKVLLKNKVEKQQYDKSVNRKFK